MIKLITNAYYASGIVSREFETVSGTQVNDGLDFLNEIIADKTIEKDMIPYFQKYSFEAVAGQEKYFIPNLEQAETIVFFINDVRYQMRMIDRNVYFGSSRPNNIDSLPFNWHLERCPGGANLYLYFFPQTNYPIEIWGLFRLPYVTINQDLVSSVARVNLGFCTVTGAGTLDAGQFVVNDVDLQGTYATTQDFVDYINTGVAPNVVAVNILNNVLIGDASGASLHVQTSGDADPTDNITFYNFSTLQGPLDQTFFPMVLDQFYISYLKFALADRLCTEFNFLVPPGTAKQLAKYEAWISKRSAPMDLSQTKISTFSNGNNISYGQVNLGLGWTVG